LAHPIATLIVSLSAMTVCWGLSVFLKDVSIVDIAWGPIFGLMALTSAFGELRSGREVLVISLVWVWGMRLAQHIWSRWRVCEHEDHRYAAIRKRRGPNFALTSLFWIFWLQALLAWVISWPLQTSIASHEPLSWLDGVGASVAIAGILIEAIADRQLAAFRADPENRSFVLKSGLWAWSRHPNYFGDFLIWWGFYTLALAGGFHWWTIVSPVLMSALLLHYSGVGLMEETIADRRPGYKSYIMSTPAFFPRPPLNDRQSR
jgi:steroid 5-alpha reductase family enzyme